MNDEKDKEDQLLEKLTSILSILIGICAVAFAVELFWDWMGFNEIFQ